MKTKINCRDLHLLERLVSRLGKRSELPAAVAFTPHTDGLLITAFCNGAVLTLSAPSADDVMPFSLPWSTVKEFATKKDKLIDLDVTDNDVTVSWSANGIPQTQTVPSLRLADKQLPRKPDNLVAHSMAFFDAIIDAAKCVDDENKRYSLTSICLRGSKNQIISTDGKQALIQDGFDLPFQDDALCPVSKIFSSKELRELGNTVNIGVDGDWIFLNVGNVNIWLRKIEGRFPQMDMFTKDIDNHSWLNVDSSDTVFVTKRLDILPGKDCKDDPVYVKLNDDVTVCGHDTDKQTATALQLARSRYEGGNVTMPMNRKYLKNAFNFGIDRIGINPNDRTPLIGYSDNKTFIFMPLEGDEPKVDADNVTILFPDTKASIPSKVKRSIKTDKPIRAIQACRAVKPQTKTEPKGKVLILDDAMKLRANLRETLVGVNALIRSIKSQRKQDKLLRDTVASLRKLQNV